jgi:hypothetical protein
MSNAQKTAILAIINANRTHQWEMVRQGHSAWRLSTADLMTFHCGRTVRSLA